MKGKLKPTMKKFSLSRRRFLEVGFLLLFPISMLVVPPLRQHFYYPTSDTFLSPWGQPAPEFAEFLTPLITKTDDEVHIGLGDCPVDMIKKAALQYLSPVIRMNPKASIFKMTWSLNVFNYHADVELKYDRKNGEMRTKETEMGSGGIQRTTLLGKYLTDRDVHQAALAGVDGVDYDVWAEKHWEK